MKTDEAAVHLAGETAGLYVFTSEIQTRSFFGLFKNVRQPVRVVDKTGVVRLQRSRAEVHSSTVETIARDLELIITKLTDFGDAGRALPDAHLLLGGRIINLSGLADLEQAVALANTELESLPPGEPLVIVAAPRSN